MLPLPSRFTVRAAEAPEGEAFVFEGAAEDGRIVLSDGTLHLA
jgi:hypothetical protein